MLKASRHTVPLVALLCAACSPLRAPVDRSPTELRVPLVRDVQSLDPVGDADITSANVVRQLYEGLIEYDPRTLRPVPRLARSWRVSDGGRQWTFELQAGVRFVDDPCFPGGRGREATASDFKYSLERGLRPGRGGGDGAPPSPIAGLEEFRRGRAEHIAGITAPSPGELVIRLERPDPRLLHLLAQPSCWLVAREAAEAYGEGLRRHPVGTGPFRLISWEPLSGILLARHLGYWQADASGVRLPYVDALRFVPYWRDDPNRLFAEGRLDMVFSYVLGPDSAGAGEWDAPGSAGAPQRFFVSRLNTIYVRFDYRSRHPAMRDRRLRQALGFALPRPVGTAHIAARGLLPPGLPGYDPALAGQRTDAAEARRLLDEAGYPGGGRLPPLRIAWREWDAGVGNQFANTLRGLGLRVELTLYNDPEYWPAVDGRRADLFREGWVADYPDPENFFQLFAAGSSAGGHAAGYPNAEYQRLFDALRAEVDSTTRVTLARRLERILVEDAGALFLQHERETQFVSARVEGWEGNCTNPLHLCQYERVRVRPVNR